MQLTVLLLFIVCVRLNKVNSSLPVFTQVDVSVTSDTNFEFSLMRTQTSRLPGLCRRLKRRRVTVMCNLEKFCWCGRSQTDRSGQVCRCPRGSRSFDISIPCGVVADCMKQKEVFTPFIVSCQLDTCVMKN